MQAHRLLTRDAFREGVFARDKHKCVVCGAPAVDAHHIMERKLWPDGGYYLANGASLCEEHHIEAEQTLISCEKLRELCGIEWFPMPTHLDGDQPYDKWGNPILDNGQRLRGELFEDAQVSLQLVLRLFTNRVKYPRTFHFPFSPGMTDDDRGHSVHAIDAMFGGAGSAPRDVVVTVKMDGENTTMYRDAIHARSTEYASHPSRDRAVSLWGGIAHDIPDGWRICGENLYAKHNIHYKNLPAHFLVFSIWDEKNVCLSWDDTVEYAALLGLHTVPVVYRGAWCETTVRTCYNAHRNFDPCEGFVTRLSTAFHYRKFRNSVAKYVRAGHVLQTDDHWASRPVVPNELAEKAAE